MIATKIRPQEAAETREDWVRAVNDLAQQVTEWAERQGWTVTRTEPEISELPFEPYRAASLEIATDIPTAHRMA